MFNISFDQTSLTDDQIARLNAMWLNCMRRIIVSTTLAGSGHPGGSMSSLHLLLLLYSTLRHRPDDPCWVDRDRLLISMGHVSPAVYSVLCEFGYVSEENMLLEYRNAGSPFAGHVECCVPGVEWNTGNLGQGLSAGVGMALALKVKKNPGWVGVLMGDGEQQKGQISEARRFAVKYELRNLFGVVDRNHLQIGGNTNQVMPQTIRAEYVACQWNVFYVEDGHNFQEVFQALRRIHRREVDDPRYPSVIVARTIMGKGISFMENKAKYHGSALSMEEAAAALAELGLDNPLADYQQKRSSWLTFSDAFCAQTPQPEVEAGEARSYSAETLTDCRSAYGNALQDLAQLNNLGPVPKVLGFSCDLEGSVKMSGFRRICEAAFFEAGIQEHHTATMAGAVSKEGLLTFFSTFGVFGVDEVYNQQRLNDINHTQLKVVCTHLGLDVGEDGQTHQCIDYLGLLQNLFAFSVFIAADPNQTDRIVRYMAAHPGNFFLGMGRSKVPVITDESGQPFYAGSYRFEPGRADWIRRGGHGAILSYGATLPFALQARDELAEKHQIELALLNCASLKPLDAEAVIEAARSGFLLTVEDHHVDTGLGSRVANLLAAEAVACRLIKLGVKNYGLSGKPSVLYRLEEMDSAGIVKTVLQARANGWIGAK